MKITRILFNTDGGLVPSKAFGRISWISVGTPKHTFGQQSEIATEAVMLDHGVLVTGKDGAKHFYPWHTIDKLEVSDDEAVKTKPAKVLSA